MSDKIEFIARENIAPLYPGHTIKYGIGATDPVFVFDDNGHLIKTYIYISENQYLDNELYLLYYKTT